MYPIDFWSVEDEASRALFEKFVVRIENFLGIRRSIIKFEDIWRQNLPENVNQSLAEYLLHAFDWGANIDQWTSFLEPFVREYEAVTGAPPVLNPQLRFKVYVLSAFIRW